MERNQKFISLQGYVELILHGYSHSGPNLSDIAAMGGYEKARGYLHAKAAHELMIVDPSLSEEDARKLVTRIVEDILNYPPEE